MQGESRYRVPPEGRTLIIEVDGQEWTIRPNLFDHLAVNAVVSKAGIVPEIALTPEQSAILSRALIEHYLQKEQREVWMAMPVQRQTLIANRLLLHYNEIRSGKPADLTEGGAEEAPAATADPTRRSSPSPGPSASPPGSSSPGTLPSSTAGAAR